jgi:hypothetical protein
LPDVRNVELVFKQGIAYDPEDLIETTAGPLGAFLGGSPR